MARGSSSGKCLLHSERKTFHETSILIFMSTFRITKSSSCQYYTTMSTFFVTCTITGTRLTKWDGEEVGEEVEQIGMSGIGMSEFECCLHPPSFPFVSIPSNSYVSLQASKSFFYYATQTNFTSFMHFLYKHTPSHMHSHMHTHSQDLNILDCRLDWMSV